MTGELRLHTYFRSSAAWRCRIGLALKGLAAEPVFVHLRRGAQRGEAFRGLNPQGLVPVLETEGRALAQSLAILEWLEEAHPRPPLLPRDPFERAEARAFALAIACDIHPLQNLRVLDHLRDEFGQEEDAVARWCRRWIGEGLAACEAVLARRPASRFAFGATPGLAECCLVPQLFSARRFGLDPAPFPRLLAVEAECQALPGFAETHPARQEDAEG